MRTNQNDFATLYKHRVSLTLPTEITLRMQKIWKTNTITSLIVLCCTYNIVSFAQSSFAQGSDGEPGVSASSPGSEGMPDTDAIYQAAVTKSAKKGKTSKSYINSLIALGMHYNRVNRFSEAAKVLRQALQIIDAGALKPTQGSARKPETVIETHESNGTVSATIQRTPYPYEETMQELLPQLASAELSSNQLDFAEQHLNRLIKIKGPNGVADKVTLMSAYSTYAELMRRKHRPKDAAMYQRKADEINASFKPL